VPPWLLRNNDFDIVIFPAPEAFSMDARLSILDLHRWIRVKATRSEFNTTQAVDRGTRNEFDATAPSYP
jgi:hypothetical protein